MTLEDFRQSPAAAKPSEELTLALSGLWWDAKGDWTRAHESAQRDEGPEGSWVACLPASQGRRSGQRTLLVRSGKQARLPRTTRCGVAQHREGIAGIERGERSGKTAREPIPQRLGCPEGDQVGARVSEVQAAFVTSQAGHVAELLRPDADHAVTGTPDLYRGQGN